MGGVDCGAMCMPGLAQQVQQLVDDAVAKGATVRDGRRLKLKNMCWTVLLAQQNMLQKRRLPCSYTTTLPSMPYLALAARRYSKACNVQMARLHA